MTSGGFQHAIDALGGGEAPRVWSLIVTVFGDLAQQAGDEIAGPVLGDILAPMGVRPEAMRVALHRLRNEGWIETRKQGRTALHGLSAYGLEQSAAASGQIYGDAIRAGEAWHMLCLEPCSAGDEHVRSKRLVSRGYVAVSAGIYIKNSVFDKSETDALVLQGNLKALPLWIGRTLAPKPLRIGFNELSSALEKMDLGEANAQNLSQLQIATLRTLIVHRWRKLALKLPLVPDNLFGDDFEGTRCRAQVLQALKVLQRPKLSDLS